MYTLRVGTAAGTPRAALGREPVGSARPRSACRRPHRTVIRSRCPSTHRPRERGAASTRAVARGAGRTRGRDARQRRKPVPPVAGRLVRRGGRGARLARRGHPRRRDVRPLRGRGGRTGHRDRSRTPAATRLRERVLACGEFSLAELRALVDVAALYIGGDSGPMHIAATSRVPMVSLYGPTLPARSQPWRSSDIPSIADRGAGPRLPALRPAGLRTWRLPLSRRSSRPQQVIEAATRLLPDGTDKIDDGSMSNADALQPDAAHDSTMPGHLLESLRPHRALRRRRFLAVLDRRRAVACSSSRVVCWASLVIVRRERIEVPTLLLPAAGLRGLDAPVRGLLFRAAHQPRRLQAAAPVPDRAGHLPSRARLAGDDDADA